MAPTALITGSSQGIGKATALLFARKGYDLVLTARRVELLESVAQEIQTLGHQAPLVVSCDVTDPSQVNALVEKALDRFEFIDVLINNAGRFAEGPVEAFSLSDWHDIIDLNLWGYIHTINALLPHFLQRKKGTIVNLSSIGGKAATPYIVPYCTSKFAVTGLTESLHAELKPKGIHVCGIYPNLVKSSLMERTVFRGNDEQDSQSRREQLGNILKFPGVEKPEDVANAIWDAVHHHKSEVLVGSASLSQGLNKLFPSLLQWASRQALKNKDN
jgi:short-subunit dehydrogenase